MTFKFVYCTEPARVISGAILDAKPTLSIKGASGYESKAYVDSIISLASKTGALTYKICSLDENMAGVIVLSVTDMGQKVENIFQVISPNYQSLASEVISAITFFINSGDWKADYLV